MKFRFVLFTWLAYKLKTHISNFTSEFWENSKKTAKKTFVDT